MTTNTDKHKNRHPLTCCHSTDSLTSVSTNNDMNICEALNNFVITPSLGKMTVFNHNNFRQQQEVYHFPKRAPVDLKFEDVTFTATSWSFPKVKREKKEILHSVSGEFKSGELSVIMGPSGAGKSTLLNILAGYTLQGSTGVVKLNGDVRDGRPRYRKLVAYIPQEEEIRLGLKVIEAMTIAAHLKLGYSVSYEYKMGQIHEILELLGLDEHLNTITAKLSGGQRKRLAIALELISNPPILFLDEPTTGLDSLSCSQCISLLKRLAQEGRTVICTIHQPSALLFEMFDKLYALAEGRCIYDGTIPNLIPYLSSAGLYCPPYHNPADFLMEVAIGEHGPVSKLLPDYKVTKVINDQLTDIKLSNNKEEISPLLEEVSYDLSPQPANVLMQFLLLYKRNILCAKRNYSTVLNRFIAHVAIACLFGYLYFDVGPGGNTILANYVYLYGSMLLIVYTGQMSVTLSFPLEMKILTREHFNRWYKLVPYLLSVVLLEIPFQLLCALTYVMISYWLTGQPADYRMLYFILFCSLGTLCAQAWGYFIGATTPIKIAVFLGPVLACLFSVFGFCIRYEDTPLHFRWMYHASYFRAAFHGLIFSMYGLDREYLRCPEEEMYCHYAEPKKFLTDMDILDVNLWSNASVIIVISSCMHIATYLTLWLKLNKR